jgi:hypothetical protein
MSSKDRIRIGVLTKGMSSFYIENLLLISFAPSLHTLTASAAHPLQRLPTPMNTPQIRCHGCDRVFNPRGLSQHLSKTQNSVCHATLMALKTPSVFQTAGSSLGSNSTHAADTVPTADPADADPADAANPADATDPADPADATDATDADLLEMLANSHSTSTNPEQDHPVEAWSPEPLAPQPDEPPLPAPLLTHPTQPNANGLDAPPQLVVVHFPHGSPGAPIPGERQGSSLYQASRESFGASVWAPFRSQCNWEIAHWAKMRGPSSSAMEDLLAIPEVCAHRLVDIVLLTHCRRSLISSDCHTAQQKS